MRSTPVRGCDREARGRRVLAGNRAYKLKKLAAEPGSALVDLRCWRPGVVCGHDRRGHRRGSASVASSGAPGTGHTRVLAAGPGHLERTSS